MSGFVNVTPGSIDAMKVALFKNGPISIAIDASHKTFSFYSNGVYFDSACGKLNQILEKIFRNLKECLEKVL